MRPFFYSRGGAHRQILGIEGPMAAMIHCVIFSSLFGCGGGVTNFGDSSGLATVSCPCREASSRHLSEVMQSLLVLRRQRPFGD
jgi:hypothetical protein